MYKHNREAFYLIFKLQGQWKTLNVLNCFLFISHSALMFIHHFIIILKKIITKKGRRPRSFTIKWSDKNCIYLLLTWWWSSPLQAPSWRSEMLAKVWASSSCRSCQPRRPAGLQWQQAPWGTGRTGQALCRDRSVQVELCPLPSTAPPHYGYRVPAARGIAEWSQSPQPAGGGELPAPNRATVGSPGCGDPRAVSVGPRQQLTGDFVPFQLACGSLQWQQPDR